MLQDLAAATGKPKFTRRSFSLRQHGRAGFAGAIRSRQASLELSTSPARSALLPEQNTPQVLPPVPRKSNWEVIEHFSSSSGSLTRSGKTAQSANLIAVSSQFLQHMGILPKQLSSAILGVPVIKPSAALVMAVQAFSDLRNSYDIPDGPAQVGIEYTYGQLPRMYVCMYVCMYM